MEINNNESSFFIAQYKGVEQGSIELKSFMKLGFWLAALSQQQDQVPQRRLLELHKSGYSGWLKQLGMHFSGMEEVLKQGLTLHRLSLSRQYFGPHMIRMSGLELLQQRYCVKIWEWLLNIPEQWYPSSPFLFHPLNVETELDPLAVQAVGTLCQLSQVLQQLAVTMIKARRVIEVIDFMLGIFYQFFIPTVAYSSRSYFGLFCHQSYRGILGHAQKR